MKRGEEMKVRRLKKLYWDLFIDEFAASKDRLAVLCVGLETVAEFDDALAIWEAEIKLATEVRFSTRIKLDAAPRPRP